MKHSGTKYPSGYVKASRYSLDEWDGYIEPKWILERSDVPNMKAAKKLAEWIHHCEYSSGFATPQRWFEYYDLDELYSEMLDEES